MELLLVNWGGNSFVQTTQESTSSLDDDVTFGFDRFVFDFLDAETWCFWAPFSAFLASFSAFFAAASCFFFAATFRLFSAASCLIFSASFFFSAASCRFLAASSFFFAEPFLCSLVFLSLMSGFLAMSENCLSLSVAHDC